MSPPPLRRRVPGAAALLPLAAIALYLAVFFSQCSAYGPQGNRMALIIFLVSLGGLWGVYRSLQQSGLFPSGSEAGEPAPSLPLQVKVVGALLAGFWVVLALPPEFRAMESSRMVQVFWHDEGITLDYVRKFLDTPEAAPEFRLMQGWHTFLPVALLCKLVTTWCPVSTGMINMLMRFYQLAVIALAIYFSFVLAWQLTRLVLVSATVVFVAYWKIDLFSILMPIDRPDGFQLLFIILSLLALVHFVRNPRAQTWFWATLAAALGFASKFAGHLMVPVLALAWFWYFLYSNEGERARQSARWPWLTALALPVLSVGLIFPLAMFAASPYHLLHARDFLTQVAFYTAIYKSGNIYNLPDFHPPSSPVLWWNRTGGTSLFEAAFVIAGGVAIVLTLVTVLAERRNWRHRFPEMALPLAWSVIYVAFLLYSYRGDLVDYRYTFPCLVPVGILISIPLTFLSAHLPRSRSIVALTIAACSVTILNAQPRLHQAVSFLCAFRNTDIARIHVGRFLDGRVRQGDNPSILMTNLAFIPERLTRVTIMNVTVTDRLLDNKKFDYVLVSDNMYDVYADKPVDEKNDPYYQGYDVHFSELVRAYSAFKHDTMKDYRRVTRVGEWEVFERVRAGETGDSERKS